MGVQPGPEGFRGPLGEHVDWPTALDIDQHRAVDMPLAQGEVITPSTSGVPLAGSGAARISRSSVDRPAEQAILPVSRAPARPPRARPTACKTACRPQVRRP
jgi:hypothetical protein